MSDPELPSYERQDLNPRVLLWFAGGLTVTLAVVFLTVRIFLVALGTGAEKETRPALPQGKIPPPRLQIDPTVELAEIRAAEEKTLHSYGWVNRDAGVVRLPIERAIEMTAERGLPARPAQTGGAQ